MTKTRKPWQRPKMPFPNLLHCGEIVQDIGEFFQNLSDTLREMKASVLAKLVPVESESELVPTQPIVIDDEGNKLTVPRDADAILVDEVRFAQLAHKIIGEIKRRPILAELIWWSICLGALAARLRLREFDDLIERGHRHIAAREKQRMALRKKPAQNRRDAIEFAEQYNQLARWASERKRAKTERMKLTCLRLKIGETTGKKRYKAAVKLGLIKE